MLSFPSHHLHDLCTFGQLFWVVYLSTSEGTAYMYMLFLSSLSYLWEQEALVQADVVAVFEDNALTQTSANYVLCNNIMLQKKLQQLLRMSL